MREHASRFTRLTLLLLVSSFAACSDEPCEEDTCCSANGMTVPRCGACEVGEVGLPFDRCQPMDAGNTCGDGLYQSALEACDPTSPLAPMCSADKVCTGCACVSNAAVCGDDQVAGDESCERNRDCNDASIVCRQCQCALASAPAIFTEDEMLDVVTDAGLNLYRAELILDGGNTDTVRFIYRDKNGVPLTQITELCWVTTSAGAERDRLCYHIEIGGARSVVLSQGGVARTLMSPGEAQINTVTGGHAVSFSGTIGLMVDRTMGFHFESMYGGQLADRMPDTGEILMTEILGRE